MLGFGMKAVADEDGTIAGRVFDYDLRYRDWKCDKFEVVLMHHIDNRKIIPIGMIKFQLGL